MQIADRFHIHQNLLIAIKKALNKEIPSSIKIRNISKSTRDYSSCKEDNKKTLEVMNKLTNAEKVRLNLICNIQQMKKEGYSISEISRLLGKDRRTIKRYITGSPNDLCKNIRAKRYNPYENRVISLVKNGYIEKQIVDILMLEGYKLTVSSARHMIQRVVKANKLKINKYSLNFNIIFPKKKG